MQLKSDTFLQSIFQILLTILLCSIVVAFVLIIYMNPTFLFAGWQLWLCAAVLPLIGYIFGYALARILRQSHRKCRTIAFETGSQNVSLAATLTVLTFGDSPLLLDMLFYPLLYACFIYIDSFAIIIPYKLIKCYLKKGSSKELELSNPLDDEIGK